MSVDYLLKRAEIAMSPDRWRNKYNIRKEMSKCEKKPVMIWYVSPKPYTYGFFSTTIEANVERWFADNIATYTNLSKGFIWC
jgi:hypothetical protein